MGDVGEAVPLAVLLEERRHLLDVAYWMLGSAGDAEQVVSEAYRRWYGLSDAERAGIMEPRAWLAQVAGSVCLARLTFPGGPQGEVPREDGGAQVPGPGVLLEEEISEVLLGALDALTPSERAAFVLNDVFGMAPGAVAGIVGQPEPRCAELADRARHSLRARHAATTSPEQHDVVVRSVQRACAADDGALLASLLAPEVTAFFDGGGKVRALVKPVHGRGPVARSLLTLLSRCPRPTLSTQSVNGSSGLVVRHDGQVAAVITLDVVRHHAVQVWVVLNPDKLRTWN
ncbi:sigma factor [Streptomyces sp. ADI93-02]|uniref:sigma factor n=1 Tax=Streptomyces sp. ADI93-02 TaxID=1522757 RepID=UPI000F5572E6|nr:sigma factor [Streptomyces sp. ADI93-02]RPK32206.1 ECF RNA polymerase sigma factor SigJ [Streptomyces sp. ADI93-02]